MPKSLTLLHVAIACCWLPPICQVNAADIDNDVEWFGVFSHADFRSPRQPVKGQAFDVELRAFRGDLTGATVHVWDGAERAVPMSHVQDDGDFSVWRATVQGTQTNELCYKFEVIDGADRDYYNALGMWDDSPSQGDFCINTTSLGAYPLGATPTPGGTVFRVWAPNALSAAVAGSFNGWNTSTDRLTNSSGIWQAFVPDAASGDEYKFVFDAEVWRTDPRARRQVHSAGNSIIADPDSYTWGDETWTTPAFEEMMIYELHVGSFSGEGDGVTHYPGRFRDVVDVHLDHLLELGVNMIELMPVCEFAGDLSWGYNPSFLYAVESAYGPPDDLKYLIDRCHQNGIGVLLDVVYNHMGGTELAGNLLEFDGEEIYFYPADSPFRETPWGPRPDYSSVDVRRFIRENVRYWLEEFHVDGFRLDATSFINVNGDGWQLLKEIAQEAHLASEGAIVIAENLPNDSLVTQPIADGGAGMDAQWSDPFHDNLRQAIEDADFGDPNLEAVAAAINHFELGSGQQVVHYIESHDEAAVLGRIPVAADGSNPLSDFAQRRAKVVAALVMFSAGIPMILQGQEFLETRPFGDALDDRIQWPKRQLHADFFLYMKDLIRLRRSQLALRADAFQDVFHVDDSSEVLAFRRWTSSGDDVVVLISLANREFDRYKLGFPIAGVWYEVLNGDAAVYGGGNRGNGGRVVASGQPLHGLDHSASIVIPQSGVLVFARAPLEVIEGSFLRSDCNGDGFINLADAVRSLGVLFAMQEDVDCPAACDANADEVVDVSDAIYTLIFLFSGTAPPPPPWPECGAAELRVLECATEC